MSLNSFISNQLASPKGIGGKVVGYFMNRQNRPLYVETMRLLSLTDLDNVLDIGCGSGYVLNMMAKRHGSVFTGLDFSESMIQAAVSRNRLYINSGKMKFSHGDFSAMTFADGSFSKVFTINTVYFWENPDSVMVGIKRVLKPGGLFINTFYSNETLDRFSHTRQGYKRFSEKQLTDFGTDAGFSVKSVPILNSAAFCYLYRKTSVQGDKA